MAVVRPIPDSDFHLKLRAQFPNSRILVVEHHLAHAASAYFPSPFDEATVLTLDRGGDFRCGSRWQAQRRAHDARPGAVPRRFARRSLRPRDGAARVRAERRRAQGAVALGLRRRPVQAAIPRHPVPDGRRSAAWIAGISARSG